MNTKIKELIANVKTDTSGKWVPVEELEHFAKVIAAECVSVVDNSNNDSGDEWDVALTHVANQVKHQFDL